MCIDGINDTLTSCSSRTTGQTNQYFCKLKHFNQICFLQFGIDRTITNAGIVLITSWNSALRQVSHVLYHRTSSLLLNTIKREVGQLGTFVYRSRIGLAWQRYFQGLVNDTGSFESIAFFSSLSNQTSNSF
ncbi:hypothetical protein D3C72_2122970 [compost metagenome]